MPSYAGHMRRIAMTLALLLPACDVQLDACTYDDDGTPPVVVSSCYRVNLPESNNPGLPPVLDVGTCDEWCTGEGMEGLYSLTYQSPDACPGAGDPLWTLHPSDITPPTGMLRCACEL